MTSYSATRWWSRLEVFHQLLLQFGDIELHLLCSTATDVFEDPYRSSKSCVQLSLNYFQHQLQPSLKVLLDAFKVARFFSTLAKSLILNHLLQKWIPYLLFLSFHLPKTYKSGGLMSFLEIIVTERIKAPIFWCVSQVIISDYGRESWNFFCAGQNGRCINMKILLIME